MNVSDRWPKLTTLSPTREQRENNDECLQKYEPPTENCQESTKVICRAPGTNVEMNLSRLSSLVCARSKDRYLMKMKIAIS